MDIDIEQQGEQRNNNNASAQTGESAKQAGLKVVYDKTYPPTTADYTPIVRAIQATNPDLVLVCSYPPDTVGMRCKVWPG